MPSPQTNCQGIKSNKIRNIRTEVLALEAHWLVLVLGTLTIWVGLTAWFHSGYFNEGRLRIVKLIKLTLIVIGHLRVFSLSVKQVLRLF